MMDQTEILSPAEIKALRGETIAAVESERGAPGGANNDRLRLTMSSGLVIELDSYSGGRIEATFNPEE